MSSCHTEQCVEYRELLHDAPFSRGLDAETLGMCRVKYVKGLASKHTKVNMDGLKYIELAQSIVHVILLSSSE